MKALGEDNDKLLAHLMNMVMIFDQEIQRIIKSKAAAKKCNKLLIDQLKLLEKFKDKDNKTVPEGFIAWNLGSNDEEGFTALMWAAFQGHTNLVTDLIKAGTDVNAKNKDGYYSGYKAFCKNYP